MFNLKPYFYILSAAANRKLLQKKRLFFLSEMYIMMALRFYEMRFFYGCLYKLRAGIR